MTDPFWRALYGLVEVEGWGTPVPKPTLGMIRQFERTQNMPLPPSYQQFILVFGPGELFQFAQIAAPCYDLAGESWDLWERNWGWADFIQRRTSIPAEMRSRLFCFCLQYKTLYLWDPAEADAQGEYPIWKLGEDQRFSRYASTFKEFVRGLWDEALDNLADPNYYYEDNGPIFRFAPATIGRRGTPLRRAAD